MITDDEALLAAHPGLAARAPAEPRARCPPGSVSWDQPHEGNLFEHLYVRRALHRAGRRGLKPCASSPSPPAPGACTAASCLRDNALAAELMARGHDVVAAARLHADAHRRGERQRLAASSSAASASTSQQHVAALPQDAGDPRLLWDTPAVIRAATGRGVSVDPELLGELTVSMLRGEEGHQAKEFAQAAALLERAAALRRVDAADVAARLRSRRRCARELRRPVVCTLQGEDLFLEGLPSPTGSSRSALIRRARGRRRRASSRRATTTPTFMAGYLGLPRAAVADGAARHPLRRLRARAAREPRPAPSRSATSRAIAPEKGLHLLAAAYIRMRRELGLQPSRLEAAGYLAPEHRTYLDGVDAGARGRGPRGRVPLPRDARPRRRRSRFLQGLDVLSVPSPYAEPKGLYLLEALASGVPVVEPRHGAFPELVEKTGGGVLFEPGKVRDLAEQLLELGRDPRAAPRARPTRRRWACAQHYSAARMAERTLEICEAARGAFASA